MNDQEPDGPYVYCPYGSLSDPAHAGANRLWGIGGFSGLATIKGLTKNEAEQFCKILRGADSANDSGECEVPEWDNLSEEEQIQKVGEAFENGYFDKSIEDIRVEAAEKEARIKHLECQIAKLRIELYLNGKKVGELEPIKIGGGR